MNIQQLNNSGQSIQTFIVTAVVILLLTGGSWLCMEEINQYRSWSRRHRPRRSHTHPTYNMAMRIRMLVWLYHNGHWAWARETKAWWYILVNTTAGFGSVLHHVIPYEDEKLSAGYYVSKYMYTSGPHGFFPFRLREPPATLNEGVGPNDYASSEQLEFMESGSRRT